MRGMSELRGNNAIEDAAVAWVMESGRERGFVCPPTPGTERRGHRKPTATLEVKSFERRP